MMSSPPPQKASEPAFHLLASLRSKGVTLWSENGKLHYKAPKGTLTPEDLESLRSLKPRIVALVSSGSNAITQAHSLTRRAPLSFPQRMHWQRWHLEIRPATRQVTSATRLRGKLDVKALQLSLAEMVRRHEGLRTCIVVEGGVPVQEIAPSQPCEMCTREMTSLSSAAREAAVQTAIEALILEPVSVSKGPLFAVELLRLEEHEHVLVLAMEHSIADAFSLRILLRDLFTCYSQVVSARSVALPPIHMQFADYALWQQQTYQSLTDAGVAYRQRLQRFGRVRFPREEIDPARSSRASVPVKIDCTLKTGMAQWSRLQGTTLAMSMFAVYSAMIMRWCDVREVVIRYQSDGRDSSQIQNTIGYFARMLYVPITLGETETFADLIARATAEYCRAYELAGTPPHASGEHEPAFAHNPAFNWIPQRTAEELQQVTETLNCSALAFRYPPLADAEPDNEPGLMLFDADEEIRGDLYYPARRFSTTEMERFARGLVSFTSLLLRRSHEPIARFPPFD